MSIIVGLVHKQTVYMGADSAGVGSDWSLCTRADPKVFTNGPFLIAYTSSFRMGQLLRYALVPPEHPPGMEDHAYMVTLFVNAARQCFKEGGFATRSDEGEAGGHFLVGYRGQLYQIEADYQVSITQEPYQAVGCGFQAALGALYATPNMAPRKRVLLALSAAERNSAGVREPFTVLTSR